MEKLMEVVQTLRKRIDEHESELSQREVWTRYSLVDPLLRALGWDTADPKQVIPEHPVSLASGEYKADYALFVGEKLEVIIEVKKLTNKKQKEQTSRDLFSGQEDKDSKFLEDKDSKFLEEAANQGLDYCLKTDAPYSVATDGRRWELYHIFDEQGTYKKAPIKDKLILQFDVLKEEPEVVCKKAQELAEITGRGAIEDDGWIPLARIDREDLPSAIRFPDDTISHQIHRWSDLLVEIVKWIKDENKLDRNRLPVVGEKSNTCLVAKKPENRNEEPWGKKYTQYLKDANVYVYTKCGKDRTFEYAKRIVKRMKLEPEKFAVLYE